MEKLQRELEDKQWADFLASNPGYDGPRDLGLVAQYYGMQAEAAQQKEAALLAAARSGDINAVRQYAAMHGGLTVYKGNAAQAMFTLLSAMEAAKVGRRAPAGPPTPSAVPPTPSVGQPQGGGLHDQELAKYGQIVGFGNVSISGSFGGGVAYEYGTIETDKGWLQNYQTVYSVAGFGISGGTTGGIIIPKGNSKPTFSDWNGLAMGGSVSYLFFGATVGVSTNYYAIGGGLGLGYGVKGNWSGTFSYAWTFLIGDPYQRPPVDLSRSYIKTQTYLGGN